MSFCEIVDHKILDIIKIKERELELFEKIWKRGHVYDCKKHTKYYETLRWKLKTYIEKKKTWKNNTQLIGSFNENTQEIINQWGLIDGQYLCICIDFEKGGFHIGDIC
jgi:hypothetical protein